MKKLLAIVLILAIAVSLCACGKVNQTMELINAIGTVTLDSEAAITAAEESYALLKEKQQLKVENYAVLQDARSTYDRITNVANLIDSVGEVTLESEAAIVAAEEAYAALSAADQATIENYDLLPAARAAYEDAKFEAFLDSIVGEWVPELSGDSTITLTRDDASGQTSLYGEWKHVHSYDAGTIEDSGKWSVDKDMNVLRLKKGNLTAHTFTFIEEDGFIKLFTLDKEFSYDPMCFVRAQDYNAAFEQKFLAVELNGENYTEYLEGPVQAGYALDENGEPNTDIPAYVMKSKLYDQGYVFLGTSEDFIIDIIREGNRDGIISERSNPVKRHLFEPIRGFVLTETWTELPVRLGDKTTGTAYFIKAEYVVDNFCDPGRYDRTFVRTTTGALFDTELFGEYTFNYEDYLR